MREACVCMHGGWDTDVRRCTSKTPTVHTLQHSMNTVGMTITALLRGLSCRGKLVDWRTLYPGLHIQTSIL